MLKFDNWLSCHLGCICVFNSEATLDYVQNSLEQSLLLYPERDPPMQGIPVVLMQASLTGLSQKRVEILQDRAQQLAIRSLGVFVWFFLMKKNSCQLIMPVNVAM